MGLELTLTESQGAGRMSDCLPTPHHMNNLKIRFKEPDIQTLHHILDACSLEVVYLTWDEKTN